MRTTGLLLTLLVLAVAAGCNATGGTNTPQPSANTSAGFDDGRLIALEARMIGLTEELDRFARRLTALERSLGSSAPVREPVAPPPVAPEAPTQPEIQPEPEVEQPATPEPEPEPQPEPEAPPPDPIKDWPVPEKSGPYTALLIDAREIPAGSLPGTSQVRWRIVDPDAIAIFTSDDVDPQVLRTRPLFWTAKAGTTLGPAAIPVLGQKPLRIMAVDGALLSEETPAEAVIYVDAKTAEKLRGLSALGDLVKTGSLAILLRPDGE